jgi:hypothetical protein
MDNFILFTFTSQKIALFVFNNIKSKGLKEREARLRMKLFKIHLFRELKFSEFMLKMLGAH